MLFTELQKIKKKINCYISTSKCSTTVKFNNLKL